MSNQQHQPDAIKKRLMHLFIQIRAQQPVDLTDSPLAPRIIAAWSELEQHFPIEREGNIVRALPGDI